MLFRILRLIQIMNRINRSWNFLILLNFLGGEKTVNLIRGPMWHGCGSGGVFNPDNVKANLGKTRRLKHSLGYTTSSGIIKPWSIQSLRTHPS